MPYPIFGFMKSLIPLNAPKIIPLAASSEVIVVLANCAKETVMASTPANPEIILMI